LRRRIYLSIKVDVTNQIFLKPGTVWRNGSPVWEPSEFFNISINQEKTEIVSYYRENNPKKDESRKATKMPFIYRGTNIQFLKFPDSTVNGLTKTSHLPGCVSNRQR